MTWQPRSPEPDTECHACFAINDYQSLIGAYDAKRILLEAGMDKLRRDNIEVPDANLVVHDLMIFSINTLRKHIEALTAHTHPTTLI